jgi:hypothetical protein
MFIFHNKNTKQKTNKDEQHEPKTKGAEPRWSSELVLTSIKCSTFKMISGITNYMTENNARLICGFLHALRFCPSIKLTVTVYLKYC